ncbi:hypothetical protein NUW58_g4733 [Xylaria curta]|uniref:Uncharacterized protein n=1 Tax=Xylaria curta TaxID=42375 RepID=A0ACC1P545_9PEZI|nr:hypothetical protein NUW58_g4733 [Xylaria curta]
MRLLNVHSLVVNEFYGDQIPRYAILSHTWGEDEVTLQGMKDGTAKSLEGYKKIEGCYVDDVQLDEMESFRRSRYWTRGWTLQELIAPHTVVFFSSGWTRIGNRLDLREVIAEVTNIPRQVLRFQNVKDFSVCQRMSQGGAEYGLLASCPAQFAFSQSIQKVVERSIVDNSGFFALAITNKGIRISLRIIEDCYDVPLFSLTSGSSRRFLVPGPPDSNVDSPKKIIAILHCRHEGDTHSRIVMVLNYDEARGHYIRDIGVGLVKTYPTTILKRPAVRQLLVAASGRNPWDEFVLMDEDPGRLVIIQPLPEPVAHFKFEYATLMGGGELGYELQENGTISIRFHQRRPIAVIYRAGNPDPHQYLVIFIKLSDYGTGIDALMTQIHSQDASQEKILSRSKPHILNCAHGPALDTLYETPQGTFLFSFEIREAEHASIVEVIKQSNSPRDPETTLSWILGTWASFIYYLQHNHLNQRAGDSPARPTSLWLPCYTAGRGQNICSPLCPVEHVDFASRVAEPPKGWPDIRGLHSLNSTRDAWLVGDAIEVSITGYWRGLPESLQQRIGLGIPGLNPKFWHMGPSSDEAVFRAIAIPARRALNKERETEYSIFPICTNGNHWVLVVLHKSQPPSSANRVNDKDNNAGLWRPDGHGAPAAAQVARGGGEVHIRHELPADGVGAPAAGYQLVRATGVLGGEAVHGPAAGAVRGGQELQ